ncbi:hypothetical protein Tco_0630174 [Tanacetum coccineum]
MLAMLACDGIGGNAYPYCVEIGSGETPTRICVDIRSEVKLEKLKRIETTWLSTLVTVEAKLVYSQYNLILLKKGLKNAGEDEGKYSRRNNQEESFTHKEEMAPMALSDSELNQSEFNLANYKRGLASMEELKGGLPQFNESEINALKIKIERLKKEKESNQFKIDNFENASKSLDKLIGSQISYNNRKGVGYNAVAPLPTGLFAPSTIDFSSSGLREFQQPEFEGYGLRVNKSVCENSSNETKKNSNAPLIEEWVSDNEDEVKSHVVVEKKTVVPTIPKVDVVRPKQQEKPVRKIVRYAEMYRSKVFRETKEIGIIVKSRQLGSILGSGLNSLLLPDKCLRGMIVLNSFYYIILLAAGLWHLSLRT